MLIMHTFSYIYKFFRHFLAFVLILCYNVRMINLRREICVRYNNLSGYLREKYSSRLKKICIDGHFSCPNRDGTCGHGGCIYCGERGAGEHIDPGQDIENQVRAALDGSDGEFIAYFQNFTNTYAPIDVLRERYDAACIDERIRILSIGTRPDCIDEYIAALIASYKSEREVWVELGLQTASDRTADLINRGYHQETFERAMEILGRYEIPVVVHLIVGLPGEGLNEIAETVEYLGTFNVWGVKIHSIYVMRGTRLAQMYESGEYTPPTLEEFIDGAVYILTHLSKKVVIHRLTGDCPRELLLAPEWNTDKHRIISEINQRLESLGLSQGSLYSENQH